MNGYLNSGLWSDVLLVDNNLKRMDSLSFIHSFYSFKTQLLGFCVPDPELGTEGSNE